MNKEENDIYYCEDCRNWLPKEMRKHNKCKAKVVMSNRMARINKLDVCKSFKFPGEKGG